MSAIVNVSYNDPSQHDYGNEAPTMREIRPGHFVLCSEAEYKKYKEIYQ